MLVNFTSVKLACLRMVSKYDINKIFARNLIITDLNANKKQREFTTLL